MGSKSWSRLRSSRGRSPRYAFARAKSSQRGLGLIESAIALAIFAWVLASLSLLTVSSMRSNTNAKRYTVASALALAKVEALRAAGYTAAASGAAENFNVDGGPGGMTVFTRNSTVAAATPIANAKTVAVTVDWTDSRGSHQTVIKTILVN